MLIEHNMRSVGLLSVVVWLIVSSTFSGLLTTNAYSVPEPRIEVLNPVGFRVSIPGNSFLSKREFTNFLFQVIYVRRGRNQGVRV